MRGACEQPVPNAASWPQFAGAALVLAILKHNVREQSNSAGGGGEEANDRQPRITEELEVRRHAHEQGRADNERREHESGRDAIGAVIQPSEQLVFVARSNVDLQLRVPYGIENFVHLRREAADEIF